DAGRRHPGPGARGDGAEPGRDHARRDPAARRGRADPAPQRRREAGAARRARITEKFPQSSLRSPAGSGILLVVGVEPGPLLRYRCAGCGYGASRRQPPERCPMCGDEHWEEEGWRPFAAFAPDLVSSVEAAAGDLDAPLARGAGDLVPPEVPLP